MDKSILRPWLELARVSNLPTVWTNVLAAWLLAGGKWEWKPLAWLLVGGSLIYTGGMFLNDAADVKFDREHRKERPIPSGRISAAQAWIAGVGFLLTGFAMFVWGAESCIWLTGVLVVAILFYDLYHKQWAGSVFIMGSCRTLLYLATASAVSGTLSFGTHHELIFKSIALGGYVTGLSLAARSESKSQGNDNLAGVFGWFALSTPAITSIFYAFQPSLDRMVVKFSFMLLPYGLLIAHACRTMRTPPPSNIGRGVGLLLAGIVLVDALAVSSVNPNAALGLALFMPVALLWQRKIAAT